MCIRSFTYYVGCGCARFHATLPCPKAFDPSLPKCRIRIFPDHKQVVGDCPECKPAFDNKSLCPGPMRIILHFNRRTTRPKLLPAEAPTHQGTIAQIDQAHNHLRGATRLQRGKAKLINLLEWIDHPDQPDFRDRLPATEAQPAFTRPSPIDTALVNPHAPGEYEINKNNSNNQVPVLDTRELLTRRVRARHHRRVGRIYPKPEPMPQRIMPPRVVKARVGNDYTIKSRTWNLTASQHRIFRRKGIGPIRKLSVVSRRHHQRI